MTKKDYELMAASFREFYESAYHQPLLNDLAKRLKADNPRFNVDKFLRAAQGED